ncbi:hypothetical protein DNTS_023975, partial [Danionella cerebrum]
KTPVQSGGGGLSSRYKKIQATDAQVLHIKPSSCIIFKLDVIKFWNPSSFPPGPRPIPFLGNVFTEIDFWSMNKLSKIYGNIFSLRVGSEKIIVVSGYKMVKEALITHIDSFIERPNVPLFHKVFKGIGTILSNGYLWRMHRKFAVSHLRGFGAGKKGLELKIQQECVYLCEAFKAEKEPFNPLATMNSAVSNIIACLIFGQRFDYHDEYYQSILRLDTECIQLAGSPRAQLYNMCPWLLEYLPGPHQTIFSNYKKITDFLRGEIRKHKEDWDPLNPRDFIDNYLSEMEKKKSDPEAGFNLEGLVITCLDMIEAGTETATTTLRWGLLFMITYPEIQEKVQAEIDRVIGQSRPPCLDDRADMHYTEATIHEIQRFGDVVPLGFPKRAVKDTQLREYLIPKGTAITINLSSVLHDPDEWETPDIFNPGHFLDENGHFRKRDAFMPFSAGKRACLGEHLARQELFLFFTSLLQQFSFSKCPGEDPSLKGEIWFTYVPSPFRISVSPHHRAQSQSASIMIQYLFDSSNLASWVVFFLVFVFLVERIKNKNPSNFPPGPWPLPFLGTVFTKMDFRNMNKLSEVYGNVFSLRVGTEKMVIVSGYEMVKEALVTQNDSFVDRPKIPLFHKVFKGMGLALNNGYPWRTHRRFAASHLRTFGEAKKTLEHGIQQECFYLCEAFKAEKEPFNPLTILSGAVSNIIACLTFGQRFEYNDEWYQEILRLDNQCVQLTGSPRVQLYNACPWLFKYLPGPHQTIFSNYKKITNSLRVEVKKRMEDWDPLNTRDFIDNYLSEMEKKNSDPQAGFNIEDLVIFCLDLVEAGTETAATTLRWGLLFMIKFPEVQEKVQAEIDKVIGQSRQPCLEDRADMHYTEAVMHEIQRFGDVVPLGFPKQASKDAKLGNYFIPKGTSITTNLSSVLHDPNQWETPDTFNPGHFLDENGHFRKREAFMPFSAGKRACVGEVLARNVLFLFFTSLLQQLTISKCPGENPSLKGEIWFTFAPEPFRISVSPHVIRNKSPANFPPGPWPVPILGNVFTDVNYKSVDQLIEKYGNIFSVRNGSDKVVYVSGFKMVKDVLITQGETFTDRPVSPLFDSLYQGRGLSFNNGYSWRKQQQFSMSHLKNFGEGRKTLEEHIQRECYILCGVLKEEQSRPFDPLFKINNAVANVIGFLVFGQRYDYDNVDFQKRLQMSAESLYDAFPSLMKWVPGSHQTVLSNYQTLANFLKEKVDQHRADWDSNNPRDFIDAYLTEAEKRKNDTEAGFSVDSLVWCMVDLFEGGTETTTNTLRWALLYLIKYPEIQEKLREEVDEVIGSRPPLLSDKANMHYMNAFFHEVLRKSNLVPLNMARVTRKDTTLGGYFIPKGTVIITNLTSVLYDQHEWETPDTFNPGHFLNSEGHFSKRNAFFAFSAGKRQCPGEYLAHMEFFLVMCMLLQSFIFSPPEGEEPSLEIMALTALLEILNVKGILLFIVAFLLVADYMKNRNPPNFPPSPFSVPLLGNIFHFNSKEPHLYLTKLGHVYNNIFSLRLGREKVVIITGYKMVKEALVTQADNFVDRPHSPVESRVYAGNAGLFFSNGEMWKKQRRFALSTLRNFGLGKKTMELAICEESRFLLDEIEGQKGAAFNPIILLNNAVSNIVCQMVFGQRFDYADHQFRTMLKYISKSIQLEGSLWGQLYEAFPAIMKHLPGPHNDIFSNYEQLKAFVHDFVVKHKTDLDPSEPRDYIDSFLIEMMEKPQERAYGFEEKNLVACVLDLFLAGTETTSTSLCWGLIYLMANPEEQDRVQEEIDRVIGNSREPCIADRANMPYTDAVIHEIQRFGDIVPLNGARVAENDTTIGQCFIPKGTAILPILHSVLFDENEWETPYKFNPRHFLDKEGKFKRRDAFMPFSAGKRVCLGEHLARTEIFLFFVSLFRKFRFSAAAGEKVDFDGVLGLTLWPAHTAAGKEEETDEN